MERLSVRDTERPTVSMLEHSHRYLCAASIVHGDVLDIACGVGYGSAYLLNSSRVRSYVGVDNEPAAIHQANREYKSDNCTFRVSGAYNLPFQDSTFDGIVTLETLEHLEKPSNALAEFRRVLKPNGILIGSVPTAKFEDFCGNYYGPNEFHIQKFDFQSLADLIGGQFIHSKIMLCTVKVVSCLSNLNSTDIINSEFLTISKDSNGDLGSYLFVASNQELDFEKIDMIPGAAGLSYYDVEKALVSERNSLILQNEQLVMKKDRLINDSKKLIDEQKMRIKKLEEEIIYGRRYRSFLQWIKSMFLRQRKTR